MTVPQRSAQLQGKAAHRYRPLFPARLSCHGVVHVRQSYALATRRALWMQALQLLICAPNIYDEDDSTTQDFSQRSEVKAPAK